MRKYYAEVHYPTTSLEYDFVQIRRKYVVKKLQIRESFPEISDKFELTGDMYEIAKRDSVIIIDGQKYSLEKERDEFFNGCHTTILTLFKVEEEAKVTVFNRQLEEINVMLSADKVSSFELGVKKGKELQSILDIPSRTSGRGAYEYGVLSDAHNKLRK